MRGCAWPRVNFQAFWSRFSSAIRSNRASPVADTPGAQTSSTGRSSSVPQLASDRGRQRREVHRLARHVRTPDPRQLQEVVNQLAHSLGRATDPPQVVPGALVQSLAIVFQQDLTESVHRAQRTTQVMRHRVNERLHFGQRLAVSLDLCLQLPSAGIQVQEELQLPANDRRVERLVQEVDPAHLVRAMQRLFAVLHRGHEEDRRLAQADLLAQLTGQLVTVHQRHLNVQQGRDKLVFANVFQRLLAGARGNQLTVQRGQDRLQGQQVGRRVVDDQNLGACRGPQCANRQ